MGNALTNLQTIAQDNCAVTYSFTFGNGRSFMENTALPGGGRKAEATGRQLTNKITSAFNNDLTDCVEVITPFSVFGHLGNGQGLFRNARAMPYETGNITPEQLSVILQGTKNCSVYKVLS